MLGHWIIWLGLIVLAFLSGCFLWGLLKGAPKPEAPKPPPTPPKPRPKFKVTHYLGGGKTREYIADQCFCGGNSGCISFTPEGGTWHNQVVLMGTYLYEPIVPDVPDEVRSVSEQSATDVPDKTPPVPQPPAIERRPRYRISLYHEGVLLRVLEVLQYNAPGAGSVSFMQPNHDQVSIFSGTVVIEALSY